MPRTVMITGAAGNLGRAVAQVFASEGDTLVLVDRSTEALVRAFGEAGAQRVLVDVDLLDGAQVDAAVASVTDRHGGIDVLCNLAGGFSMGAPVHSTQEADWQRMQDLNVRTVLNTARAVVPGMVQRKHGKIVNVGANAALRGAAGMGAYVASKAQVLRLTETMAAELREHGINVNCVLPSIIDTPENRANMPDADPKRWVKPTQLAAVIAFLASDAAAAVHGACLPVTGLS
ncbi:MAG: short-chain dehydrogenase/reductase [Ramlibacter sp.]|jgi:NAD(P)-dependent dehydrogenase (short-subunit alcohol dehydrogenase family)|uniref:SDR family NAD(P)-dependent oxidoreductase n=1 Tax=Ramlibacter sp. TaxID=1917967 RepID=UPI00261C5747|nr:SDR family NAD(P)-dependent oxidoreductase [Ramlibacter sp.]MDB5751967.1 short-chain dehydrogenase/reductase [Ramlibacter sp.]